MNDLPSRRSFIHSVGLGFTAEAGHRYIPNSSRPHSSVIL